MDEIYIDKIYFKITLHTIFHSGMIIYYRYLL